MSYYVGIDLGTSALKLLLVDTEGNIVNSVTNAYDVHYPAPGWSEQYPADWWNALTTGIKELIKDVENIIATALTPVQLQIIEEKEYKGKTIEEIAKALSMQPPAVKMQLSRARKKIREIYKEREL